MKLFKQLADLLFGSTDKPVDKSAVQDMAEERVDKVANFNKIAPQLFGPQLKELGYELQDIKNSEHNGFFWSTHHIYENRNLNLTVDIQQAPYYTDYGFSIFLFHRERQDSKLLCNVPHELQDREDKFVKGMRDRFFSHPDVISLLKGETWKTINHLRND